MPTVFVGHGSPMHVLSDNKWTQAWERLGRKVPRPKAILFVSAHWLTVGTGVTAMEFPPTIHDFSNFPRALHEMVYPAPGAPGLARRTADLLDPVPVSMDMSWGLDHGTWSVLSRAYPDASVPVVQLSIDATKPPAFHFETGRRLAALRDEGVLILGSGNVVHNLMLQRRGEDVAYDWAVRFNDHVRNTIMDGQPKDLVDYQKFGNDAALSVPTPDHFYPLLYVAGAACDDKASLLVDGVHAGSMSMLSVLFGDAR